ncbi:MAG: CDP-alcohol phosphatidyltransferase family protein [Acidobacteria bacterium]|nr:CDP-alcohol phosphatidyltransferase family protein [Acidobacteriota bacterium]
MTPTQAATAAAPARQFKEAARSQASILAPLEKQVLIWLARRMPDRVSPDHLTALGLLSLAGAGLSYWYAGTNPQALHLVNLCLALNWFGDSLDGTLARVRNRLRPRYGFYVDHVIDAFGTFFLLAGLGLSSYMNPWIAAGLLIAYFLLTIETHLATYAVGTFHLSFWKLSPTELRILLVIGNLALLYLSGNARLFGYTWRLFDAGGAIGIAAMAIMLLHKTIRHTIHLYNEERLP